MRDGINRLVGNGKFLAMQTWTRMRTTKLGLGVAAVAAFSILGAGMMMNTKAATIPSTLTFGTAADTTLNKTYPTTNYGGGQTVETDNSPIMNGLLKFTVSGTGGAAVQSAKIRLYVTNASVNGGSFYRTADTAWSETAVNWNTGPAADTTPFATLGSVTAGQWVEVDASSIIKGDGTYSIRINST